MSQDEGGVTPPYQPFSAPGGAPPPPGSGPAAAVPAWVRPEPPALKPGVIPLRPLDLSALYNGAIAAIRANPRATLGITAVVVVIGQLAVFAVQAGPISALLGGVTSMDKDSEDTFGTIIGIGVGGTVLGALVSALITLILSGILTVTIGRSVFGEHTTSGQAWQRTKPRIWALLGLALVQGLILALAVGAAVGIVVVLGTQIGVAAAVIAGLLLALIFAAFYLYLYPIFSLASPVLILEQQTVFGALRRSMTLVRTGFWRLLGVLILTGMVVGLVAAVLSIPFAIVGQLFGGSAISDGEIGIGMLINLALSTIGTIVAQIVTLPFRAAVNVLLYTDQRMRTEAFDLVLQTESRTRERLGHSSPDADSLWLPARHLIQPR